MEKLLQHALVKQGLIIAYYFSNIWYRKGLFSADHHISGSSLPKPNPDTEPHLDHTNTDRKKNTVHQNSHENEYNPHQSGNKKSSEWDEDVQNNAIPKNTD